MKSIPLVTIVILFAYILIAPGMLRLHAYLSLLLFTVAITLVIVKNNSVLDRTPMRCKATVAICLIIAAALLM